MYCKAKVSLITGIFLFIAIAGRPQLFTGYNFTFKTYTTANGLVHNAAKKCASDSKGFLWIITENGLSRFDGYQFKNYKNVFHDSSSLPENNLWDIAITDKDEIFLAYKFGLCRMDPVTGRFSIIRYTGKEIQAERICYNKSDGVLYIATREAILKYDTRHGKADSTSLKTTFQDHITNLVIDNRNELWVLIERHGYYRYNISHDTFVYYDSYDWPMHLYQDNTGVYYMGTWGSGFQVFKNVTDESRKERYHLKLSEVPGENYIYCGATEAPLLTGNDIVWVIGNTSGIGLFSKSQKKFIRHFGYYPAQKNGISTPFNWSIYTAPDGNLWICTWHGLMKVNPLGQYFQNSELPELHSPLYNAITGIIDDPYDKNIAWMAVQGNGIAKYSKQENKILGRYYADDKNGEAWYLERWPVGFFKDSNQVIWSGTYGGLIKINKGNVSFMPVMDSGQHIIYTESFTTDSKGNIWLSGRFIAQYNPYTGKTVFWRFPWIRKGSLYAYGVTEGPGNSFYIASEWGLLSANTITGTTKQIPFRIPAGDSTAWSSVYSVKAIGDNIYFGTSAGLAVYNTISQKTSVVGAKENLKPVLKNALYKDRENNLWIYCSSGLFRFKPSSQELSQFTTADGVYTHSNDVSCFFEYNGHTYLGSRMAYTRFSPELINSNHSRPVPLITSVVINDSIIPNRTDSSTIHLGYRQRDISFDFTAIEYNFPEKITFSTFLSGFDKDWSAPVAVRTKNYTNLPPGSYTFKVKAFNNKGLESQTFSSFSFIIKPPFWQTWWFRLLFVAVVLASIFTLYRWRVQQIGQRQEEKNKLQQIQLEQYRQQLEMEQIISFFSSSLVGKESIAEVLTDTAKNLIGKMGFEDCMIYLWDADKRNLVQYAGHGVKGAIEHTADKAKYHIPAGKGIIGAAVDSRQPLLINDTSKDDRYISVDGIVRLSELCVPVLDDEEVIGAINIEQSEKDYFTKYHLQAVSTIATLMANKIKSIESTSVLYQKQLELADANRQLAERELAMLRSQMNPHFIFNSLNSVQKYIWESKEEDAAEYLASFAKLMRNILENSRHEYITLQKETEFLKLYIDLENRRSNNSFNYIIKTDQGTDTSKILIPPMLLQPFIENAIWHGLNKKTEKGNLLVHIYTENESLICVVDDDGVGRQYAPVKDAGKRSLGISITQQRIERLIESTSRSASVTIKDKTENGRPAGTTVTVILPLQTGTSNA